MKNRLLDYLPPIIAFAAAVIAVAGSPKWDPAATGLQKVTSFGWVVLAIGAAALVASILVTARNKSEQAKSKKLREQIAAIGRSQLLRGMNHMIHPIRNSTIWRPHYESPEVPLDMLSQERRRIFADLNINAASPYADGSFTEIKWHCMLQRAASEGAGEITISLQIYSGYLSPEVMGAVTRLLYSDFLRMRLLRIGDIVTANTHKDPHRKVPFFFAGEDRGRNVDYEEFWKMLSEAMTLCGADVTPSGSPMFRG